MWEYIVGTSGFPGHRTRILKMCLESIQFPPPCLALWSLLWCLPGRLEPTGALWQQDGCGNWTMLPIYGALTMGRAPVRASWGLAHLNLLTQGGEYHTADPFCLTTNPAALETFFCACHRPPVVREVHVYGSLLHRLRCQEDNETLVSKVTSWIHRQNVRKWVRSPRNRTPRLFELGEYYRILSQAKNESQWKLLKYKTINLDFNSKETHTWPLGNALKKKKSGLSHLTGK